MANLVNGRAHSAFLWYARMDAPFAAVAIRQFDALHANKRAKKKITRIVAVPLVPHFDHQQP